MPEEDLSEVLFYTDQEMSSQICPKACFVGTERLTLCQLSSWIISYIIPRCHTDQQRNSFKTATDWNHVDNTTDHAASVQRSKALAAATQHLQAANTQSLLRCTKPDYWMKQRTFQEQDQDVGVSDV